jgi:hypothetical protein
MEDDDSGLFWFRSRDTGFYEARGADGCRYELRWTPYGTRKTWDVCVNGDRVPLAFYSRLKDAMDRADTIEGNRP